MPVFQYVVLNGKDPQEIIEIEQGLSDHPLKSHPITKEPIRKLISSPTLSLRHSDANDKRILSEANLKKNGFSSTKKISRTGPTARKRATDPNPFNPKVFDDRDRSKHQAQVSKAFLAAGEVAIWPGIRKGPLNR